MRRTCEIMGEMISDRCTGVFERIVLTRLQSGRIA